ncbi:hypothetical protein LMG27952_06899 [Paraburkholderia hiiakae]|uniref:Uncharacterized protein n=1 Tax=Paraburkholderia hiiakae TaxID=1081782 RepID=A0ABN7IGR0_9BURK|nr:hypothetical protein LMG27952_06899 [Paraburkholderia hiiakae]
MTALTHGHRSLIDLSARDLVAIRMLNNGLSKAEYWIRQHCATLPDEARPARLSDDCSPNATGLRIDVQCVLRESDPCFDPCNENVVANLDGLPVLAVGAGTYGADWRDALEPSLHPLSDMRICHLFRDLYEHGVARDWNELVRIGEISVEISRCSISEPCRGA